MHTAPMIPLEHWAARICFEAFVTALMEIGLTPFDAASSYVNGTVN